MNCATIGTADTIRYEIPRPNSLVNYLFGFVFVFGRAHRHREPRQFLQCEEPIPSLVEAAETVNAVMSGYDAAYLGLNTSSATKLSRNVALVRDEMLIVIMPFLQPGLPRRRPRHHLHNLLRRDKMFRNR